MKSPNARSSFAAICSILSTLIATHSLQAQPGPLITQQPTNQLVLLGAAASFTVTATSATQISYAWQFNGTNNNVTSQTLSIPVVHHANLGSYDVVVTDQSGSITSSVVTIRLTNDQP